MMMTTMTLKTMTMTMRMMMATRASQVEEVEAEGGAAHLLT